MRKLKQSVIFWIMVLPFIVFIPINILSIYISNRTIDSTTREILEENSGILRMTSAELNDAMKNAINYLDSSCSMNPQYQYMLAKEHGDGTAKVVLARSSIMRDIDNYIKWNTLISGVWVYFDRSGEFISRYNKVNTENIFDLKRDIYVWMKGGNQRNWSLRGVGDKYYLVYVNRLDDSCYGIWISLDNIIGSMEDAQQGNVFFLLDNQSMNTLGAENIELAGRSTIEWKESSYYITLEKLNEWNFSLGALALRKEIRGLIPLSQWIILYLTIIALFIIPFILFWLYRKIVKPLQLLHLAMQKVAFGDTDYRVEVKERQDNSYNELEYLLVHFNRMLDDLNEVKLNLLHEQIRQQETRLRYISQQIKPHFILNALNIIYMYEDTDFPEAKKVILYLTKYFRYVVNLRGEWAPLAEELRHTENYLAIQKLRYNNKFDYYVNWEKNLEAERIPPLVIQTFVENCIKYAFADDRRIAVFVSARRWEDSKIKISISDSGNGFLPEVLIKIEQYLRDRSQVPDIGIGIQNEIERLDILYEGKAVVRIDNSEETGAEVEIILPTAVNPV